MLNVNTVCRECESPRLRKAIDLGAQPPANAFLKEDELAKPEATFPLEVHFCEECSAAQLVHVVDKSALFRNYVYFSSVMPKVSPYWEAYALDVIDRFLGEKSDLVVEIGSNDGILLTFFKDRGYPVLGVDPAQNIAKVAEERGVPTLVEFFGQAVAQDIVRTHGKAKAILANNVVAHIDDHQALCAGVKALLEQDGVWVIEAPYLVDMFENLTYDTIYHEHLGLLSVRPMARLFKKHGLELFDVRIVPSQGQSLRLFIGHEGMHPVQDSVAYWTDQELALKLDEVESYLALAERIAQSRSKLTGILNDLKAQGKRIAAYGAPAKGNTLLNYCQIGPDILDFALEDMASKQGLYSPGMHVKVVDRAYAEAHPPDYYLLLAWNYAKAILEKEQGFVANGGRFIVPIGDDPGIL